jgi:hypothetical protein
MNLSRLNLLCATVVVACTLYGAPALAQRPGTADLVGSVTDESDAVLPAASVVARHQLTGVSHAAITGADGTYRFVSLTPGVYEVTARLDGFRSVAYPDVRVSVGEVARLDFQLALSALSETISVVGRPPAVDVAQTQLGQVVQSEQLANLPVGIRSFVNFASLAPGVNANFARAGASFTAGALSSNGQDNRFANFTIDGAPNNDDLVGQTAAAQTGISVDAILEFQVLTNQASAEYGRNMGTVLNMVTKSGTNVLNGSAWLFARNDALEAINEFTKRAGLEKPPFRQEQFGANIGGPLVRDRTHAFVNVEEILLKIGQTIYVPTRTDLNQTAVTTFTVLNIFGRVDHRLSDRHTLMGRYVTELSPGTVEGAGGGVLPENTTDEEDRDESALVTLTSAWSKSVNQLRISYTGESIRFSNTAGVTPRAEEIHPSFRAGSAQFIQATPFEIPVRWSNRSFQFENSFSLTAGRHELKAGGSYYHAIVDRELFPRLGTFTFANDLPFDRNTPSTYPIRYSVPVGDRSYRGSNHIGAAFVDDRWQARPDLTVNLGVRWEGEAITPDRINFGPRLGLAWDPRGNQKAVLRASYGISYGQSLFQFYELGSVYGPEGVVLFDVRDNGPLGGQFPVNPVLAAYPQVPTLSRSSFPYNPNPDVLDPDRKLPSINTVSVGGQTAIGDVVLKSDYVYSRGRSLFRARDINPYDAQTGLRPDPQFNRIRQFESTANSWYHALLTSATRRFADRYQLQASYTLGRAENDADNPFSLPNDEFNPAADKGDATSNRTHILAVNGMFEASRHVHVSGIYRYLSGDRYSPITVVDANRDLVNDRLAGYDRNTFTGSSFKTLDLRLTGRLPFGTRELQLTADLINTFNWVNYSAPNNVVTGTTLPATFGAPQAALEGRQLQLGVRVNF